ncbi:hypothetical protein M5D96_002964 [Drosophila gunungcola]|uniref:Uncharacterized protein n=1 Tax=Drosophila gunungcola TaxID=103775 RepID=A0A9P9Z0X4_9MUSC|nr:hypothetical protein M5D96_002964 [Drosophila gunungcola]
MRTATSRSRRSGNGKERESRVLGTAFSFLQGLSLKISLRTTMDWWLLQSRRMLQDWKTYTRV